VSILVSKLKRCFCVFMIALSLLGNMQQSRAFCAWTECGCAETSSNEGRQAGNCHCCKHKSHRNSHVSQASKASEAQGAQAQAQLPSRPDCWCCQHPEPRDLRDASVKDKVARLYFASLPVISWDNLLERDQMSSPFLSTTTDDGPFTALEVCADLCRYLI
jgi:hypothetical protein